MAVRWTRRRRIAALLELTLTPHERERVGELVPLTRRLPEEFQPALEGKMMRFFDQVTFRGCEGLDVTEDMELSIAAQACLLIVNSDAWYDNLRTILVYPGAFKSLQRESDGFVVTEKETTRLGESWHLGPVVLSWRDSLHGGLNEGDGRNVVLHEFAHQLDNLSGHTDGAPILPPEHKFSDWSRVIGSGFETHSAAIASGLPTFIAPYGAEGPEEFFAEIVELFFEKPSGLHHHHPEIYAQLEALLRLDPINW